MNINKTWCISALAGAFGCIYPTIADADEFKWKMAAAWSGGPYLERDAQIFVDHVHRLTEGRVEISLYPGGTLYSPLEVTDGVRAGVAEAGHNWTGYDWGFDKTTIIFAGYPGGMTPEGFMLWLYEGGGLDLWKEFRSEQFDVISFPCSMAGTEIFMHSNKPVQTLEDLQGLKLRTAGAWAEIAGRLGAATVALPGGEVYEALERGAIDAMEWGSPEVNQSLGFHEVAQYIIVPGLHQAGGPLECQFNKAAWDELSAHDQEMIELAGKLTTFETWLITSSRDLEAFRAFEQGENTIIQVDDEFIAAVKAATREWLDENSKGNSWFERALDSQDAFKSKLATWGNFRFPIGSLASD